MESNRYRIDPVTGQMGFSSASNQRLINNTFENVLSADRIAKMHGMRAGDIGQIYQALAGEGRLGGGDIEEKTRFAVRQMARDGFDVAGLGQRAGVDLGSLDNLDKLDSKALGMLRKEGPVQEKLLKTDTQQLKSRVDEYVESLAAMREVLGENGDTNAPVPKLINALKALTSGQWQKFDAAQLNTMVRDIQSMSQTSGKSIDQIYAMTQMANQATSAIFGPNGVSFNPTAVHLGVSAGSAFAQVGAPVGYGAISREQAEQMTIGLFSRSLGSEMGRVVGAISQYEQRGQKFADNASGRELGSIMSAIRAGQTEYEFDGKTRQVPFRERDFNRLISGGALSGIDLTAFRMMTGDTDTIRRALASDKQLQMGIFAQQSSEADNETVRAAAVRLKDNPALQLGLKGKNPVEVARASSSISRAVVEAINGMDAATFENAKERSGLLGEIATAEAKKYGADLSSDEASAIGDLVFGQYGTVGSRFGFDSATSRYTLHNKRMKDAQSDIVAADSVRTSINSAMSRLGPRGGILQRAMTSIQKQGDRGEDASISMILSDMFGVDKLSVPEGFAGTAGKVQELHKQLETIGVDIRSADPQSKQGLLKKSREIEKELNSEIDVVLSYARLMNLTDNPDKFDVSDAFKGRSASREMDFLSRTAVLRSLTANGEIDYQSLPTDASVEARRDALAKASGVELTDEQNEIFKRQAEDQLLAENQLISLGQLKRGQTILDSSDKHDAMDPELRTALGGTKDLDKRVEIVRNYVDRRRKQAAMSDTDPDKTRAAAIDRLKTSAGKETVQGIAANLESMSDVRRAFLQDPGALLRGGIDSLVSVKRSRDAEMELQSLASAHYGGDIARMLASGGAGMTPEEHAAFSSYFDGNKAAIAKEMGVDPGSLTLSMYRDFNYDKAMSAVKTMRSSTDYMSNGAGSVVRVDLDTTGMTPQQKAYAESVNKSSALKTLDASQLETIERMHRMDPATKDSPTSKRFLAALRRKLTESGLSDEQIDLASVQYGMLGAQAKGLLVDGQLQDLNEMDVTNVAAAFGDDPEKFTQAIGQLQQTSALSRNLSMMSGVFKNVDKLGDAYGGTSIDRLDRLTDEYADPASRKSIADKMGIMPEELDRMMRHTRFLGLGETAEKFTTDSFMASMRRSSGVDIQEKTAEEEAKTLTVEGTINFTGDVVGQGTWSNSTARAR